MSNPTAYISLLDFCLAENELTNEQLTLEYPDFSPEKILKTSGIAKRYVTQLGTICTDFAAKNVKKLLSKHQIDLSSIDFLLYCTEAPDYIAPASSVILHEKLGLRHDCGTFDLNYGCSGYTYGLLLAKSLIESNIAKNILFVTADIPSNGISKEDKFLRFLFSDAVSMTLISSKESGFSIGKFIQGTDGSGETALRVENSGFNTPRDVNWFSQKGNENLPVGRMTMDGERVFHFSLEIVPKAIQQVLEANNLQQKDIDLFVFHQASKIILKSLQRKLSIPDERIFNNIEYIGNTVSASIPIALKQALEQGRIKRNKNILIIGFGIGFSWSATILNTSDL